MVDFAKGVPYYLEASGWDNADLEVVEERLAKTPCYAGKSSDRVVFPERKAPELLTARWTGVGNFEA